MAETIAQLINRILAGDEEAFGCFAKKEARKTTLVPSTSVVLELDEMWHYIGNKRTNVKTYSDKGRNTPY